MRSQPSDSSKLEKIVVFVFSPKNLRYNFAVIAGAATIAIINWLAMSQSGNGGLASSLPVGGIVAPALGGLITGAVLAYSKRPAYLDGAAGSYAAFAGIFALIAAVAVARFTGGLPENGTGFERFGPISLIFFFALVGAFNMAISFPITFVTIFLVRMAMPGNEHRYGWVDDTDIDYVTPVQALPKGNGLSTAVSRFNPGPVQFTQIPARHRYRREE